MKTSHTKKITSYDEENAETSFFFVNVNMYQNVG